MRSLKQVMVVTAFLLLVGCGFHLRGYESLPVYIKQIAIQAPSPYDPLVLELKRVLRAGGVVVVEDTSSAPLVLDILGTRFNQQLVNISANSLVKNYNLAYHVTFELVSHKNKVIYGPHTVTVNSAYTKSSNQILGDDNLLQTQKQNMMRNAVNLLLSRLNSKDAHAAVMGIR